MKMFSAMERSGKQGWLLIDDGDSGVLCLSSGMKKGVAALNAKDAFIGLVQTGHDLHKGALARAVLTH